MEAVIQCNQCPTQFKAKSKKSTLCPTCRKQKSKQQIKNYHSSGKAKITARNWRLKKYYNFSSEGYNELLTLQDGVCAICKEATHGDNSEYLCIDHDHKTGKVRGLLCDKCNRSIGSLRDNPKLLNNAALYLFKSQGDNTWDRYFLNMASLVASRSKDISVQVGAVLVRDKVVLSTGYNGFPRGCNDNKVSRYSRPEKYDWTVHAEENALLNAGRFGIASEGSTLYVTPMYPCAKCTRAMIQCGVKKVIAQKLISKPKWDEEFKISRVMMEEAGVEFIEL
jgi:dCMP deaminase